MALDDMVWSLKLRIRPRLWVNIHALWDSISGLTLKVDGASHGVSDPVNRNFQQLAFDAFMGLEVGLNVDGTPLIEESRFEISKFSIYDWTNEIPLNDIGKLMGVVAWVVIKHRILLYVQQNLSL